MTPEQATPRHGSDAHNELLDETCGRSKFPLWFTASETAQIAKAYAHAHNIHRRASAAALKIFRCSASAKFKIRRFIKYSRVADKAYRQIEAFEKLFAEWQK